MTLSTNRDGLEVTPCQVCGGLGNMGYPDHKTPCPECGGAGKQRDKKTGEILYLLPCNKCGGAGKVEVAESNRGDRSTSEKEVAPMNLHERFERDWDTLDRTGLIVLARDLDAALAHAEADLDLAKLNLMDLRSKLEQSEWALERIERFTGDAIEAVRGVPVFHGTEQMYRAIVTIARSARSEAGGGKA